MSVCSAEATQPVSVSAHVISTVAVRQGAAWQLHADLAEPAEHCPKHIIQDSVPCCPSRRAFDFTSTVLSPFSTSSTIIKHKAPYIATKWPLIAVSYHTPLSPRFSNAPEGLAVSCPCVLCSRTDSSRPNCPIQQAPPPTGSHAGPHPDVWWSNSRLYHRHHLQQQQAIVACQLV